MNIEDTPETQADMRLYNEVVGIALAIWSHVGDGPIFRVIDKALDSYSIAEMENIRVAFNMLPDSMQQDIMAEQKSSNTGGAVERFSRYVQQINGAAKAQTA